MPKWEECKTCKKHNAEKEKIKYLHIWNYMHPNRCYSAFFLFSPPSNQGSLCQELPQQFDSIGMNKWTDYHITHFFQGNKFLSRELHSSCFLAELFLYKWFLLNLALSSLGFRSVLLRFPVLPLLQ